MASTSDAANKPEEKLSDVFDNAMKLYTDIENTKEPTNSPTVQQNVQKSMRHFESATQLVSLAAIFSSNESVEELSTDSLQYLLLPALLGTLSLKITNQPRREVINVAEIYFRDFLQRCKDYGISDVAIPQAPQPECDGVIRATQSEQTKLVSMIMNREEKLKRYKEQKELQQQLATLKSAMESPNIDESTKREYFITMIKSYVNQGVDELNSIEAEKPLLDYMEKAMKDGTKEEAKKLKKPPSPLKPIIITKDAIQKAVYGLGYPSIPVLTVEEFYEQRVRDGSFPDPQKKKKGPTSLQDMTEADMDVVNDQEDEEKERKIEEDDEETLQRARNLDEYKDDHRRGWGNRHNRS